MQQEIRQHGGGILGSWDGEDHLVSGLSADDYEAAKRSLGRFPWKLELQQIVFAEQRKSRADLGPIRFRGR